MRYGKNKRRRFLFLEIRSLSAQAKSGGPVCDHVTCCSLGFDSEHRRLLLLLRSNYTNYALIVQFSSINMRALQEGAKDNIQNKKQFPTLIKTKNKRENINLN